MHAITAPDARSVVHPKSAAQDARAPRVRQGSAIGRFLRRQWQVLCEQAERPTRQVPYY